MAKLRDHHNEQLKQELIALRTFYENVRNSRSWKLTAPLRQLNRLLKKLPSTQIRIWSSPHTQMKESDRLDFDPFFYKSAYPESAADPLYHYLTYGQNSGKLGKAPELTDNQTLDNLDTSKKNILLVVHDADRSGTPILTYNIAKHLRNTFNVLLLPLHGGELVPSFHQVADIVLETFPDAYDENVASAVLDRFLTELPIEFAIVNSIISRTVLRTLAEHFIPSICLIHEFPAYICPKNAASQVQLWASRSIFSSRLVYKNTAEQCPELKESEPIVIPQGRCSPPVNVSADPTQKENDIIKLLKPNHLPTDTILIIGVGKVEYRKGVDLFIDCAARLMQYNPELSFSFAWVGPGYDPISDLSYSAYLNDQLERTSLTNKFSFTGNIHLIETVYQQADLLFLSSRLDPLPNTAIEAMCAGVPVVCFNDATGIADVLAEFDLSEECVAPYLRTDLAADKIATLCKDPEILSFIGSTCKNKAEHIFDMARYTGRLSKIALKCGIDLRAEKVEYLELCDLTALDLSFFLPPTLAPQSSQQAARLFIRSWRSGIQRRKPCPGFHPGIYAELNGVDLTSANPFLEFLRTGKPDGPWLSPIITPLQPREVKDTRFYSEQRIGLHIHCYYPEMLQPILRRIRQQFITQMDLLISVVDYSSLMKVREDIGNWNLGDVDIRKVPNRGRDIGPFLTEFGDTITKEYDIIGHIHTKQSQDVGDNGVVQLWSNYLFEHLLGSHHQIIPTILYEFSKNTKLGLVFPEDPYVVGWSGNRHIAKQLSVDLGISDLHSQFFNFPVGNMFWARPEALKCLFDRNFSWQEYPEEPLPYDGTLLHGLERITPSVANKHGYQYAMTHIPGMTR